MTASSFVRLRRIGKGWPEQEIKRTGAMARTRTEFNFVRDVDSCGVTPILVPLAALLKKFLLRHH